MKIMKSLMLVSLLFVSSAVIHGSSNTNVVVVNGSTVTSSSSLEDTFKKLRNDYMQLTNETIKLTNETIKEVNKRMSTGDSLDKMVFGAESTAGKIAITASSIGICSWVIKGALSNVTENMSDTDKANIAITSCAALHGAWYLSAENEKMKKQQSNWF